MRHFSPLTVISASLPFLSIVPETVYILPPTDLKETLMDTSVSEFLKVPLNLP